MPLLFFLQLALLPVLITTTILSSNTTDLLALLSFKASISSDPLESWNQTLHYCKWQGITCGTGKHSNRVTSISLNSINLVGLLSPSISNLTFLQILELGGNQLQGNIPQSFGHLTHLKYLNLSYNSLGGKIPPEIANCSALQNIILSNNRLTGLVPIEFGSFVNLLELDLISNALTGNIPSSVANLSSLVALRLGENNMEGSIPENLAGISGLQSLQLSQNRFSGKVPSSIYNLSSLFELDLGGNGLSGTLPPDIGQTLPNLQDLSMYDNQFEGPIPKSLSNFSGLQFVVLANNSFTGPVPPNLGALQNLSWLVLSRNHLEAGDSGNDWTFLDSLTNCSNLDYLELYRNEIRDVLPKSIANLSTQVSWLTLGHNQISGSIPPEIENLVGLEAVFFEENLLTGAIPDTIGKLVRLQSLWLFDNKLSGEIPFSLGNLTQLSEMYLEVNELEGTIPASVGNLQSLITLNMSYNNLSGEIPKELLSISSLSRYLDLSYNSLTGILPLEVGKLINLEEFNVSNNRLSGEIPGSLGQCQTLEFLYMDSNFFQGSIPPTLTNLKGLQELNLSNNDLSGQIPDFLHSFKSLHYLNLSFNNFEGKVPKGGFFANMTASSITGNANLCGGEPSLHLQECSFQHNKKRKTSVLTIILVVVPICLLVLFSSISVFVIRYRWKNLRKKSLLSVVNKDDQCNYVRVSYAELYETTDGFSSSCLIGVGSYGSVYKGTLVNGETVAVKVLDLQQQGAQESFMAECEASRNIRHRNLVKVLTSCSSLDSEGNEFKAIVYEFMPNGSLEEWLHQEDKRKLSLVQMLSITIDVANAFEYLHHDGKTPVVHCDLKPSNVLIDDEMAAHVGDFGLARFLSTDIGMKSLGLKGSIGYIAPEYGMGMQVSTWGDVYSYGILLLEMLTGLRPTSPMFKDGLSLRSYVQMSFPEKVMEIIDQSIFQEDKSFVVYHDTEGSKEVDTSHVVQELLVSMIRIGLKCSEQEPSFRMHMKDVSIQMQRIGGSFLGVEIQGEKP